MLISGFASTFKIKGINYHILFILKFMWYHKVSIIHPTKLFQDQSKALADTLML